MDPEACSVCNAFEAADSAPGGAGSGPLRVVVPKVGVQRLAQAMNATTTPGTAGKPATMQTTRARLRDWCRATRGNTKYFGVKDEAIFGHSYAPHGISAYLVLADPKPVITWREWNSSTSLLQLLQCLISHIGTYIGGRVALVLSGKPTQDLSPFSVVDAYYRPEEPDATNRLVYRTPIWYMLRVVKLDKDVDSTIQPPYPVLNATEEFMANFREETLVFVTEDPAEFEAQERYLRGFEKYLTPRPERAFPFSADFIASNKDGNNVWFRLEPPKGIKTLKGIDVEVTLLGRKAQGSSIAHSKICVAVVEPLEPQDDARPTVDQLLGPMKGYISAKLATAFVRNFRDGIQVRRNLFIDDHCVDEDDPDSDPIYLFIADRESQSLSADEYIKECKEHDKDMTNPKFNWKFGRAVEYQPEFPTGAGMLADFHNRYTLEYKEKFYLDSIKKAANSGITTERRLLAEPHNFAQWPQVTEESRVFVTAVGLEWHVRSLGREAFRAWLQRHTRWWLSQGLNVDVRFENKKLYKVESKLRFDNKTPWLMFSVKNSFTGRWPAATADVTVYVDSDRPPKTKNNAVEVDYQVLAPAASIPAAPYPWAPPRPPAKINVKFRLPDSDAYRFLVVHRDLKSGRIAGFTVGVESKEIRTNSDDEDEDDNVSLARLERCALALARESGLRYSFTWARGQPPPFDAEEGAVFLHVVEEPTYKEPAASARRIATHEIKRGTTEDMNHFHLDRTLLARAIVQETIGDYYPHGFWPPGLLAQSSDDKVWAEFFAS